MKVLVVEDDLPCRLFLSEAIKQKGFDVSVAENGEIGLELFESLNPDLVFTDICMPKMDGIELLSNIRERSSDAIVVITTAGGSEEYTIQALRLHANDFLLKPIRLDAVIQILSKYASIIESRTIEMEISDMIVKREMILQFDNQIQRIGQIANRLILETGNALSRNDRLGIRLGLFELIVNAIEHGNLGINYDEKSAALQMGPNGIINLIEKKLKNPAIKAKKVMIHFQMNHLFCEWLISDEGNGFNLESIPDPLDEANFFTTHGRGILLSRLQFDEFEHLGKGNLVRARKKIKS